MRVHGECERKKGFGRVRIGRRGKDGEERKGYDGTLVNSHTEQHPDGIKNEHTLLVLGRVTSDDLLCELGVLRREREGDLVTTSITTIDPDTREYTTSAYSLVTEQPDGSQEDWQRGERKKGGEQARERTFALFSGVSRCYPNQRERPDQHQHRHHPLQLQPPRAPAPREGKGDERRRDDRSSSRKSIRSTEPPSFPPTLVQRQWTWRGGGRACVGGRYGKLASRKDLGDEGG
jgi:hypothetical protein